MIRRRSTAGLLAANGSAAVELADSCTAPPAGQEPRPHSKGANRVQRKALREATYSRLLVHWTGETCALRRCLPHL